MTSIRTFEASGDNFSIGYQLGQNAAHALNNVLPTVERFMSLERQWGSSEYIASLEAAGRAAFPQFMREIEGIAEGAGVPFARIFLWNCRGDVPGGGDDETASEAPGCTTFLIPRLLSGEPNVIGHNEDGEMEEDGECFLVTLRPDDGPAITSFYVPGLLPGHSFGLNHAGLVQTINHIRPFDQKSGIPRHLVTRAILACESLDAALQILQRKDRASGFHHNLGQMGDPRLLSIEAPASGCVIQEATESRCHANHLIHPPFDKMEQASAPSSLARQARGDTLLREKQQSDPIPLLGDTATAPLPIYRKDPGREDPNFTLASGVFEIYQDSVDWRIYHQLGSQPDHQGRIFRAE